MDFKKKIERKKEKKKKAKNDHKASTQKIPKFCSACPKPFQITSCPTFKAFSSLKNRTWQTCCLPSFCMTRVMQKAREDAQDSGSLFGLPELMPKKPFLCSAQDVGLASCCLPSIANSL